MNKFIGMNFKDWCSLDTDDDSIMNIKLFLGNDVYHYTSNEKIEQIDMLLLQQSTIKKIDFINNEWYIELILTNN